MSPGLQSEKAVTRAFGREFGDLDLRLHGKLLVEDDLRGVPLGVDVQNQRRGELRRVLQLRCDMKKHEVKIARPVPNSETLAADGTGGYESRRLGVLRGLSVSSVSTFCGVAPGVRRRDRDDRRRQDGVHGFKTKVRSSRRRHEGRQSGLGTDSDAGTARSAVGGGGGRVG